MKKRLLNNKGAVGWIIVGVIAAVVVIAVLMGLGLGLGGGKGDGEGDGNVSAKTTAAVQQETTPETVPVIEELKYLEVTVTDNDYLYQNAKLTLNELIEKLKSEAGETSVKVTDDGASKRAYQNLISALKENKISYIEANQ